MSCRLCALGAGGRGDRQEHAGQKQDDGEWGTAHDSAAPIPQLTIDETWYDKANNVIGGGKGVINGLLQPGEVQTIEIRTPVAPT